MSTFFQFPSGEVFSAYAKPLVDSSTEKPKWRTINVKELETFVWEKLGWDPKYLEQQTHKSLLKWNDYLNPAAGGCGQSYQMHITSFAHSLHKSEADQRLTPTARSQGPALPDSCTSSESTTNDKIANTAKVNLLLLLVAVAVKNPRKRKSSVRVRAEKKKDSKNASKKNTKNSKKAKNTRCAAAAAGEELKLSEESCASDAD
ncbi:unnamed protein product [Gongylonema pulchrum]|uniref:DIOX_N domain-containing protein n=1 Tax=Gongylonema pulchrum TaxID=637853 RepID=A0A183D4E4_9BILA|nr:unnamed protein product [Gongylonema pulchrum]